MITTSLFLELRHLGGVIYEKSRAHWVMDKNPVQTWSQEAYIVHTWSSHYHIIDHLSFWSPAIYF